MASVRDIIATTLRTQIPALMAVTGAQVRVVTSAARVEPKLFASGWVSVVAQFEEKSRAIAFDQATGQSVLRSMGHLTLSDALVIPDGSEYSVGGAQPHWTISAAAGPHQVRAGLVTYVCVRDEPLSVGADRGAGR
jgi:hypothetical protein